MSPYALTATAPFWVNGSTRSRNSRGSASLPSAMAVTGTVARKCKIASTRPTLRITDRSGVRIRTASQARRGAGGVGDVEAMGVLIEAPVVSALALDEL